MSEEYKIKVNMPMFELGELERFDNNIHSIVEEYSKMQLHEKEQILTQRIIIKQEEEIERLKELIKTLYFREDKYTFKEFTEEQLELLNNILYGSDKE